MKKLSENRRKKVEQLVRLAVNKSRLKKTAQEFGLEVIKFHIEIMSAEEKYLFNYLSGAFSNKDLKNGAKNLPAFLEDRRFTKRLDSVSGRAIYHKAVVRRALLSVGYLKETGFTDKAFILKMNVLCRKFLRKLERKQGIVLIGVPMQGALESFDRLLAHEVFHLALMKKQIWFQNIDKKYAYLDEGLAHLLSAYYIDRVSKLKDMQKRNAEYKSAYNWYESLNPLNGKDRLRKIRTVYRNHREVRT
ncbi:hypothetical protein HOD83_02995 [Candidatus Woesearchaeota archaeon]|jgi:hypothetical protein|nr:hypothetical protein [Candidatus Woesearchaeota archaeon]MBT4114670.1 hypothetical protein [Candidatus Woesearchaeota archaeon]MBT4248526.1 hypothetical protein [Candidatus Woesearchaeota archaeon]